MNVIMSIHPKYAQAIIDGKKLYEYRKLLPKRTDIIKVYIYASKPTKAIIAYFTIKRIINDTPSMIWSQTHEHGGITKKQFQEYFQGHTVAHAIEIDEVVQLDTPINPKQVIKDFTAPQNYCYLEKDL